MRKFPMSEDAKDLEQKTNEDEKQQDDKQQDIDVQALLEERERLLKHNETLLAEKKAKQEQARQAQLERERLEQEQLRKNGDIEKLEKAWQEKLQTYEQQINDLKAERERDIIQREARNAVSKLTADPKRQKLLSAFVEPEATIRDGVVWYKDENGQPVLTEAEFINRVRASGEYDVLIDGSRASGTGSTGNAGQANKQPHEYTEAERLELAQSNPEQFKQLFM